ncbi:MAG: DUF924 family protein [Pseudomonadota bacterium]
MTATPHDRHDEVLEFWFGRLNEGVAPPRVRRRWFAGGAALDAEIRERFATLVDAAAQGALHWRDTPRRTLAFILVCDQFARHVHRGTARAFATDALALAAARAGIERGFDRPLGIDERAFFYMPFEHSESAVDQHAAVGLFTALREDTPASRRRLAGDYLRYARQHRDIVLRFGRFPHRNRALDRESNDAERAFLASASHFGQGAATPGGKG